MKIINKKILVFILYIIVFPSTTFALEESVNFYESPQNYAFELRFGLYLPDVDSEFSDSSPFGDVFGNDGRLLSALEFDWQIVPIYVGTFGVGGTVGYFTADGKALLEDGSGQSEQEVTFNMVPLELLAVVRFDWLANNISIPLVPYFKIGIAYYIWWSSTADKTSEDADGNSATGGVFGWKMSTGVMLRLDQFDRDTARDFDTEWGVNHSYLFFEWFWNFVDGFGSQINLGDTNWSAGLALEF